MIYAADPGAAPSEREALFWLRLSAERGNPEAQYTLGGKYASGQGMAQDDREAANWYQRAAQQNHPGAQFELGNFYASGRGVSRKRQSRGGVVRTTGAPGPGRCPVRLGRDVPLARSQPVMPKQCAGIARPPSRDMPRRSTIWRCALCSDAAWQPIRVRRSAGFASRPGRVWSWQFNLGRLYAEVCKLSNDFKKLYLTYWNIKI